MAVLMRLLSLILIVIALILLGYDAISSLERGGALTVHSLDAIWALLNASSLNSFKAWLHDHALFAAQPIYSFLSSPGWGVTGVVGVILAFIFGKKMGPQ